MAIFSPCAKIKKGMDFACARPSGQFYQQMVIINYDDIDQTTVNAPWKEGYDEDCPGKVSFALHSGKTGYDFKFPEKGNNIYGKADFSTSEKGYVDFLHVVNTLVAAKSVDEKCTVDGLLKGKFVIALQYLSGGNESVEIYGLQNGLTIPEGSIDPANEGGISPVEFTSSENAPEDYIPLIYDSTDPVADFDSQFANAS